ncbi:hypothetical protein FOL47_007686 [Perkinsus chesapeaki]|uniref:Uncharacterized protein n=1 Tax=Perkinsus chesapeaki TaxID=330153 RepID=A0A7J6LIT1_PERCH|nr:hypothetical protein FOL47_007686 [Perkinsus chesapeaki]
MNLLPIPLKLIYLLCHHLLVGGGYDLNDHSCFNSTLEAFDYNQVDAESVNYFTEELVIGNVERCHIARLSAAVRVAIWKVRQLAFTCFIPTFPRISRCPVDVDESFTDMPQVGSLLDEAFISSVTASPEPGRSGVYSGFRVHLFLKGATQWRIFSLLYQLRAEFAGLQEALAYSYGADVIDLVMLVAGPSMARHHSEVVGQCDGFVLKDKWEHLRRSTVEAAEFVSNLLNSSSSWSRELEFSHRSAVLDVIYRGAFAAAARLADSIFVEFGDGPGHEASYKECLLGTVAMNLLRSVPFAVLDKEAWLERFLVAAMAMQTQTSLVASLADSRFWPSFEFWHLLVALRTAQDVPGSAAPPNPRLISFFAAPFDEDMVSLPGPTELFEQAYLRVHGPQGTERLSSGERLDVMDAVQTIASVTAGMPEDSLVYVTIGYGSYLKKVIPRWLQLTPEKHPLLVYTVGSDAARECRQLQAGGLGVTCLGAPEGLTHQTAKYTILSFLCSCGVPSVYLDLNQALLRDPSPSLAPIRDYDMAFSSYLFSDSLNPSVIYSRPSKLTCQAHRDMLRWLWESPFADDREGWNAIAGHTPRDQFIKNYRDGQVLSFASHRKGPGFNFTTLDSRREFASGDGWITFDSDDRNTGIRNDDMPPATVTSTGDLVAISFWSMDDPRHGVTEDTLFDTFYGGGSECAKGEAGRSFFAATKSVSVSVQVPKWVEDNETAEELSRSKLVSVSYAEGCCEQSKERNRQSALGNGIDEVRMYNGSMLDPEWRQRNSAILSLPRGAGYWLWKPFVILDTLLDDSLPWFSSVVLYLDAGNHYTANPRSVVGRALLHTDVAAPLLKCCLESDWAKRDAIRLLAPAEPPAASFTARPRSRHQFSGRRKTPVAVDFVKRWLRACEDYRVVTDYENEEGYRNYPTFTRHVHDQAAFSILFKLGGFTAFDLDDAHRVHGVGRTSREWPKYTGADRLRRLSKDSLSSLPSTEERVYSIVTQSDAIKGFKNYIVKGEYLPCDYQGCLMYACGYCKKTSGMLATTSFTCPSVKLVRDDHQRTIMQTHAGDFCDLAPKEKIDHFEDRTCPAILGLGKGVPPAQAYSEQLIRVKPYKGANPRVTAQFAAKKEEDITGRLPVLKDGTVDCTHLLLHFEAGQPPPVPINPLWSPGGEAFPPPPADGSPPTPQTVYANGQPAAPGGGQLDANHPLAQGPMNLSRSYTFSLHYVVFIMSTMLLFLSTS